MPKLQLHTPEELARRLSERVRDERLRLGWRQCTLAARSGVSVPTLRRYERTGRTSVENLLRLCHALGRLDDFAGLLVPLRASSMEELERQAAAALPRRRRGKQ